MKFPSIKDVAAELRAINEEEFEIDPIEEKYGEGQDSIDVRLQVLPNGHWQVNWGDPQYDTDHRGYWGASSVPGNGRRFNAREVAEDLIEEAKDQAAQSGERFRNPTDFSNPHGCNC